MAELKKSDGLPQDLSAEILLLGALTLEQGEFENTRRSLKKGLENLILLGFISNRVAKKYKQLLTQLEEQKGKTMKTVCLFEEKKHEDIVSAVNMNVSVAPSKITCEACYEESEKAPRQETISFENPFPGLQLEIKEVVLDDSRNNHLLAELYPKGDCPLRKIRRTVVIEDISNPDNRVEIFTNRKKVGILMTRVVDGSAEGYFLINGKFLEVVDAEVETEIFLRDVNGLMIFDSRQIEVLITGLPEEILETYERRYDLFKHINLIRLRRVVAGEYKDDHSHFEIWKKGTIGILYFSKYFPEVKIPESVGKFRYSKREEKPASVDYVDPGDWQMIAKYEEGPGLFYSPSFNRIAVNHVFTSGGRWNVSNDAYVGWEEDAVIYYNRFIPEKRAILAVSGGQVLPVKRSPYIGDFKFVKDGKPLEGCEDYRLFHSESTGVYAYHKCKPSRTPSKFWGDGGNWAPDGDAREVYFCREGDSVILFR